MGGTAAAHADVKVDDVVHADPADRDNITLQRK